VNFQIDFLKVITLFAVVTTFINHLDCVVKYLRSDTGRDIATPDKFQIGPPRDASSHRRCRQSQALGENET
jgi:hypothetical protein